MSSIIQGIQNLVAQSELTKGLMEDIMDEIMSGKVQDSQLGSFLTALSIRGESPEIISAAARVMRKYANQINPTVDGTLVDTCGTGGDNSDTFNISTLAAIVAAGAGVSIAKHGNRSISSKCGSADILEAFGANVSLDPKKVEDMINKIQFGFMFAPKFHPAMKYAMPTRRSLSIRTIFNILGPLTNPASADRHVMGVFSKELVPIMANVMKNLGAEHVFVVHSEPGIDEVVPIGNVHIGEVKNGEVKIYSKKPQDFGFENLTLEEIQGGTLEKNLEIAKSILNNEDNGPKQKIVEINAGYAILSSGLANNLKEAIEKAHESIASGSALNKLNEYVKESNA